MEFMRSRRCFCLSYALNKVFQFEFICDSVAAPAVSIDTSDGLVSLQLDSLVDDYKTTPFERRFNPYDFNGGFD